MLGAPARLLLEVSPTEEDRTNKEKYQILHDKIADALAVK